MKNANDHIVKIGKALSDKTRVLILKEILKRHSISCGDAMNIAALSQPTVSYHIKVLVDAGLLNAKKVGRHVLIAVNRKVLDEFGGLISKSGTL